MESLYKAPSLNAPAFVCPHCGVYATMQWQMLAEAKQQLRMAVCQACFKESLWKAETAVYPAAGFAPPPHAMMPEKAYTYYNKARSVNAAEPAAACAFLRQAVQVLFVHMGGKGKDLAEDIAFFIEKELGSRAFWRIAEEARITGPRACPPLKIDERDDGDMAQLLFYAVNKIVEEAIASPQTLAAFYAKLSDPKKEPPEPEIDPDFFNRP